MRYVFPGNCLAYIHWQLKIASGEKEPGFRIRTMNCDEIISWNTVAIGHDDVVAFGGEERFVQDSTLLKSFVLMPDMLYFQMGFVTHTINELPGFVGGSIVCNHHFKICVCLAMKAPQNLL